MVLIITHCGQRGLGGKFIGLSGGMSALGYLDGDNAEGFLKGYLENADRAKLRGIDDTTVTGLAGMVMDSGEGSGGSGGLAWC